MRLAREAGLNVPEVRTETSAGKTVMMIRRFDRSLIDGKQHRRHRVSALTKIRCDETESKNKSYWDIADKIRMRAPDVFVKNNQRELFGRMIFNILVTNEDDRLCNHAFLWDAANKGWQLSPLNNALSGYSRFGLTLHDAKEIIHRIWRTVRQ